MNTYVLDPKNTTFLEEVENKIGAVHLNTEEVNELLSISLLGHKKAIFLFGLYLLLDLHNQKRAILWLQRTKDFFNLR